MNLEKKIANWFKDTWGGSLVLPNGWFGKPYDNIHQLESISENIDELLIVLDDGHLKLKFEGKPQIEVSKSELVFCSFKCLLFNWIEYGSSESHSEEYHGGEVKFVAPPGV